ncbi:uncharacterized protein PG986_008983 [Apiospora aurea]|uniref:Uncharacterized protein n=1 Tax=Apiospora aurea TaxID=335848 RepID=A0ABR1Q6E9_9PEZI
MACYGPYDEASVAQPFGQQSYLLSIRRLAHAFHVLKPDARRRLRRREERMAWAAAPQQTVVDSSFDPQHRDQPAASRRPSMLSMRAGDAPGFKQMATSSYIGQSRLVN